jgi:PKD repeat protein
MKKKILLLFFIIIFGIIGGAIFFSEKSTAGTADNVYGWAWSENIGWISFNNITGGGSVDYGVNIDATGVFSGYAWSENIGWISFNESDLTGCPQTPCRAWVDITSGNVYGWAKALSADNPQSGGWDGWISLNGSNYGVNIDFDGEFHGWAWGSDVVGWISFNCDNPESGDVCSQSDYKVYTTFTFNQPPSASDLRIDGEDYCTSSPEGYVSVSWLYQDTQDDQKSYRIQIATDSGFSNIVVDYTALQTRSPGTRGNALIKVKLSPSAGELEIPYSSTPYYWRIKVQDSEDNWSDWAVASETINTPHHPKPSVDFTWSPENPAVDEEVQFTDQTVVYGGAVKQSWYWEFTDGNPSTSTLQNPTVSFSSSGDKQVTLTVTDSDAYSCSRDKTVSVTLPLPGWTEIPPK